MNGNTFSYDVHMTENYSTAKGIQPLMQTDTVQTRRAVLKMTHPHGHGYFSATICSEDRLPSNSQGSCVPEGCDPRLGHHICLQEINPL